MAIAAAADGGGGDSRKVRAKRAGFAVVCGFAVLLSVFNFVNRQPDLPPPVAAMPVVLQTTIAPSRGETAATAAPPPPRVASSRRDILTYLNQTCLNHPQHASPGTSARVRPAACLRPYQYVRRWVDRLTPAAIAARSWAVVNVGANKGYAAASVLDGLGIRGFSASGAARALHVHAAFTARVVESCADQLCGDCCECSGDGNDAAERQRRLPKSRRPSSWSAYVVEPSHASFEFLKAYFDAGGDQVAWTTAGAPAPPDDGGLQRPGATGGAIVEHALVGTAPGDVDFPDCSLGAEDCHVFAHPGRRSAGQRSVDLNVAGADYRAPSKRRRPVKSVRLDDMLPPDVRYIDVLITSTSGADFGVADSLGQRFFDASSVGLYIWEVPKAHRQHLDQHGQRQGVRRSFDAQIRKLERASMVCYLPLDVPFDHDHHHQPSLLRISHGCTLPSVLLADAHGHLIQRVTSTAAPATTPSEVAAAASVADATVAPNSSTSAAAPAEESSHARPEQEGGEHRERRRGPAAVEYDLHIVCANIHERHLIDALRSFESPDMDDTQVHPYYSSNSSRRERQHVPASFSAERCDAVASERSFYEGLRRELNGVASAGSLPPYESCRLSVPP